MQSGEVGAAAHTMGVPDDLAQVACLYPGTNRRPVAPPLPQIALYVRRAHQ